MTSISSLVCFFKSQQTAHRAAAPRHKSRSATLKTMSHRRNKQVQLLNIKHSVLITQNFSLPCEELKCLPVIPHLHFASFPVYPSCEVSVTHWNLALFKRFSGKGDLSGVHVLSDSVRRQKAKTGHRWQNCSINQLKCNEETEVFRSTVNANTQIGNRANNLHSLQISFLMRRQHIYMFMTELAFFYSRAGCNRSGRPALYATFLHLWVFMWLTVHV